MDTQTPTTPQVLLAWKAPAQPKVERSARWYVIGGTVVLLLAVYGIVSGSWPFAIVMILLGAMYFLLRGHTPEDKAIAFTDVGVRYNDQSIPWNELSGYWLLHTPDYSELHLVPTNEKQADIVIQTGTQSLTTIRETLSVHIPELIEKRERFVDFIIRLLKL